MRAAPVGVTRSAGDAIINDRESLEEQVVAGAGTGRAPCAVCARPLSRGKASTLQVAAPMGSILHAAATMSAIESALPTS